jgi:hypothetical protein
MFVGRVLSFIEFITFSATPVATEAGTAIWDQLGLLHVRKPGESRRTNDTQYNFSLIQHT